VTAVRVFYNASALPERPAGAGVYTLQLGHALAARDDVDVIVGAPRNLGFGAWKPSPSSVGRRLAWEQRGLADAVTASGVDVYHGPHFVVPKTKVPSVATVHDLTFFRLPRRYGLAHRAYYRRIASSARRASRIIVPSAAVAADVVRYLGYPPARVRVIPEAPRSWLRPADELAVAAFRARAGLEAQYLACLGTAEPGKRAVDAIRALPAIRESAPGTLLALAGNPGRLSAALAREVSRLALRDAVRFLGYLPDEDLPAFLTGATALLFPSLYEGFGLPPLEAMACGTPVIASDAPAMSEVLRGAAMLVPPGRPAGVAREAQRLLSEPNLHAERSATAREFAARFSWTKTAEETVAVYRELAR
jgi:glycosyltransferase involved in cell wall biosynthesis